jgi:hypothetical protein
MFRIEKIPEKLPGMAEIQTKTYGRKGMRMHRTEMYVHARENRPWFKVTLLLLLVSLS